MSKTFDECKICSSSSSSGSESSQDEGWTEGEEEALPPKNSTIISEDTSYSTGTHCCIKFACRVLRLELPVDGPKSFLGIEREKLVVTCQLRGPPDRDVDTSSFNVASATLPTSYHFSKRHISWNQAVNLMTIEWSEELVSLRQAFAGAALHFMLWSSNALLGQADFPLNIIDSENPLGPQIAQLRFTHAARKGQVQNHSYESWKLQKASSTASFRSPRPSDLPVPEAMPSTKMRQCIVSEPSCLGDSGEKHSPTPPEPKLAHDSLESASMSASEVSTSSDSWPKEAALVFEIHFPPRRLPSLPRTAPLSSPGIWQRMQGLIARPSDALTSEEADLLWRHRHTVIPQDSRALVKLLRAWMLSTAFQYDMCTQQRRRVQDPEAHVLRASGDDFEESASEFSSPVLELLEIWRTGPNDLSFMDAMKLLGAYFVHPAIRSLALQRLEEAADEELSFFSLQLVQLLRYEATFSIVPSPDPVIGSTPTSIDVTTSLGGGGYTHDAKIDTSPTTVFPPTARANRLGRPRSLGKLLIERACRKLELANALFWHLEAQMKHDRQNGHKFEAVRFALLYTLRESNEEVYKALCGQDKWFKSIIKTQYDVREGPGLRERKQARLRRLLAEKKLCEAPFPVPLPVDTSTFVTRLDATSACIYGSKTYPAFITFLSSPSGHDLNADIPLEMAERDMCEKGWFAHSSTATEKDELKASYSLSVSGHTPSMWLSPRQPPRQQLHDLESSSIKGKVLIFKCREDLRQDQLVLQLFNLMDTILKHELGLDLCLTHYSVMAMGPGEGVVQYVPHAYTIADILASADLTSSVSANKSKIMAFFRKHSTRFRRDNGEEKIQEGEETNVKGGREGREEGDGMENSAMEVDPKVMDTYVKSCAGYCVMTYLLGIGDRHLHNIMLCPDGHLFHIDFGFILGKDPKPTPLLGPFRLSLSMVEGMGGKEHENFKRFKQLCTVTFQCLRRHASLIIWVVGLMVDAGLKDLGGAAHVARSSGIREGQKNCSNTSSNEEFGGRSCAGSRSAFKRLGSRLLESSRGKSTQTVDDSRSGAMSGGGNADIDMMAVAPPSFQESLHVVPPHHIEASQSLRKMESRFRLDLTDDEAEKHFDVLVHKAIGALAPQVIEALHNLALKTK